MKKRFLLSTVTMAAVILFSYGTVKAAEIPNSSYQRSEDKMIVHEIEELDTEVDEGEEINNIEKGIKESKYKISPYTTYSESEQENTDPNNALLVQDGNKVQGTLKEAGEMRWYAFILDNKSKISLYLQMANELDADLYLFSLNQETYELELIGGSAVTGNGITERAIGILDEGIYYFAVDDYSGSGTYSFTYYQSVEDIQYEVNDDLSVAASVNLNENIFSYIDNPFDKDYFCINLSEASAIRYSLSNVSSLGYKVEYAGGAGGIIMKGQLVSLKAGKHYFKVYSPNGNYSRTSAYTLKFDKIAPVSTDSTATVYACCEKAGIVFQCNPSRTNFYVNGNLIDFSYSYVKKLSNSNGSQNYNIQLKRTANFGVCLFQTEGTDIPMELQQGIPDVARYHSSTLTGISNKDVLTMSVHDWNSPCYSIHNNCSGAYAGQSLWKDLNVCNIFVDPDTGKVIDIEWLNYFYEIGNHSVTYYRPYTMKYYYPYWNGKEPENGDD